MAVAPVASVLIECGQQYGFGRLRRSLTLAQALERLGICCNIYVRSESGMELVLALGFDARLADRLPDRHDLLILDTASDSAAGIADFCAGARVSVVVDDLAERPVVCDYIVNPNLYAAELDYGAYGARNLILGADHALVHEDFFRKAQPIADRDGIVVSFGGTDNGQLAAPVARRLAEKTGRKIHVPIPAYLKPADDLVAAGAQIEILQSADMPQLLGGALMYVGAAGATVLEALAAKCRVCAVATQIDQHKNIAYMERVGIPALDHFDAAALADMAATVLREPGIQYEMNPLAVRNLANNIYCALMTKRTTAYQRAAR